MNICIDLETKPRPLTDSERYDNALTSKKNPKRVPDKRAEWAAVIENQDTACAAMAVDPSLCRIVVASVIVDGGEPETFGHWDDELPVLTALWGTLHRLAIERPGAWTWVGHNIINFDLPVLRRACMRHGYNSDVRALYREIPTYRYDKRIHDNVTRAADPGNSYVSAHVLAQSIGVQDKGDQAVINFPALWAKGADCLPELMARCEADVRSEWAVFERFMLMWGER